MAIRVLLTCAPDASGYYRIEQPTRAVQVLTSEFDSIIAYGGLPLIFNHATQPSSYVGLANTMPDEVDLVVLQRPMWYFMPSVIRDLQAKGIPVIVEIDDDFHAAHPDNRGFNQNHPRINPAQNWQHLGKCVQLADHVIVSTDALAKRYGSHGRVSVLRNYATDWWLSLPHRGDGRTLGWPGSTVNHPTDPQAAQGAVATVLAEHPDWKFVVIGGEKYQDEIRKAFDIWPAQRPLGNVVEMTPWKPLDVHPYLVNTIDVGIVPLADTAFNAGKSWLKGLEFAALGIPFVASATPEYIHLEINYGIGRTVENKGRQWRRMVNELVENQGIRAHLSGLLRERVAEHLTISKNAWRWAEVWQQVASRGVRSERIAKTRPAQGAGATSRAQRAD